MKHGLFCRFLEQYFNETLSILQVSGASFNGTRSVLQVSGEVFQ